ncbi:MAG TPA: HAD family hydrolase [Pirellulales bacterium]
MQPQQTNNRPFIGGVVFDLDGTLVDSGLDFDQMRREMRLADDVPLLEALAEMEPAEAQRCWQILKEHEQAGADRAVTMAGVESFLAALERWGIHRAVVTRNSREMAVAVLERLAIRFELVWGREDGPVKPDPAAIAAICRTWQLPPERVAIIGDYRFDLEAGRAAGIHTVLYLAGREPAEISYLDLADRTLASFAQPDELLAWMLAPAEALIRGKR